MEINSPSEQFVIDLIISEEIDKRLRESSRHEKQTMRVYVQPANAFDRYSRAESSSGKIVAGGGCTRRDMLPDVYCCCYMCIEMARDTPGSPMPRPRDLGTGGGGGAATATLTSGAYHAAAADTANMHGQHALQQKILEVTYDRGIYARCT